MTLQYSIVGSGDQQHITVFVPGDAPLVAGSDHVNFEKIVEGARNQDENILDLFDVTRSIERHARLSDRVSVKYGKVYLDNDPVDGGALQDQIVKFVQDGQDFGPLVAFYERLVTNPLGDVREAMFEFIEAQSKSGSFTITPEGKVLGYKAVHAQEPEWREGVDEVLVPSRRGEGFVNGRDVSHDEFIEQVPGDVVEMARSRVLHEPSQACGDGLHIGTWAYASSFLYGETKRVMLVEFDPRDVVSVPLNYSEGKIRVCRYKVIDVVTEPVNESVFSAEEPPQSEEPKDPRIGTVFKSGMGPVVLEDVSSDGRVFLRFDDDSADWFEEDMIEQMGLASDDGDRPIEHGDYVQNGDTEGYVHVYDDGSVGIMENPTEVGSDTDHYSHQKAYGGRTLDAAEDYGFKRVHGKGGPTSQAAKGNGKNPHQDNLGRFSAGRPGSTRDPKTGRFS